MGIRTGFVPLVGKTRTNVVVAAVDTHPYLNINRAGPSVETHEVAALHGKVHISNIPMRM